MAEEKLTENVFANQTFMWSWRGVAPNFYLMQGFKYASAATITKVVVTMAKSGTPAGYVWAEIWDSKVAGSSHISGNSSDQTENDVSAYGAAPGEQVTCNFNINRPVYPGALAQWYIVLASDDVVGGDYILTGVGVNDYADGSISLISGAFVYNDKAANDMVFELHGIVDGGDTEELLFASPFKNPFNTPIQGAT